MARSRQRSNAWIRSPRPINAWLKCWSPNWAWTWPSSPVPGTSPVERGSARVHHESMEKRHAGTTRRGDRRLRATLIQAALAGSRTRHGAFAARNRRILRHRLIRRRSSRGRMRCSHRSMRWLIRRRKLNADYLRPPTHGTRHASSHPSPWAPGLPGAAATRGLSVWVIRASSEEPDPGLSRRRASWKCARSRGSPHGSVYSSR